MWHPTGSLEVEFVKEPEKEDAKNREIAIQVFQLWLNADGNDSISSKAMEENHQTHSKYF
jgi:hypothetical protein